MRTRQPAQAGAFYEDSEGALRTQIHNCFLQPPGPGSVPSIPAERDTNLVGLVVPHAGYMYSGPVAAHSYYRLASSGLWESIIILGPNHTGRGTGVSTLTSGEWNTPLGEARIDSELAERIVKHSSIIDVEDEAHRYEHSIEVQLPFLQFIYPRRFKFVPVCMMMQDLGTSKEVGEAVASSSMDKDVVIIASSDWTHYEPHMSAVTKDKQAIDAAIQMDEKRFQETIEDQHVSACGYGPVTALIHAAKIRGARNAELLCYKTSGDITGEKSAVVGYAAMAFTK